MRHEPLKDRAMNRWHGILPAIGIPPKALTNRHGPCPICGGKDRFRFDNKGGRGTWICSHCGAGDGIELVKKFLGCDFKEAARRIEQHIGAAAIIVRDFSRPVSTAVTNNVQRDDKVKLWNRSKLITPDDIAGRYLFERCGLTTFPPCLRFAPDERYTEAGQRPTWHPMLVAKVDPSDEAVAFGEKPALHRTYLSPVSGKAEVAVQRKMMGAMPSGAAVRLSQYTDSLGIAEGIETALSASALFGVPVWAALNANLLQEWTPPKDVTTVYVFGDNDASATGQAAAYTLAHRLKGKGLAVTVEIPARTDTDWNDVWRERRS